MEFRRVLFRSYVLVATVVFVLLALAGAALSMLWGGRHALEASGLDFFFTADWNPVENRYGALVPIYGTIVTAMIAMLIAIPVSFGIAFFLTEVAPRWLRGPRSEEHTSELQSLMRISYAVFCLQKKKKNK